MTASNDVITQSVSGIKALFERCQLDLSDEIRTQDGVERILAAHGMAHKREARLSASDIPDFLLENGVVIEVKLRGQRKMSIYRQLRRYAKHPEVAAIVLLTNVAMGLPEEIEGKPAYLVSLSLGYFL